MAPSPPYPQHNTAARGEAREVQPQGRRRGRAQQPALQSTCHPLHLLHPLDARTHAHTAHPRSWWPPARTQSCPPR